MIVDCENCRLFALPTSLNPENRTNRPGGLHLTSQALDLCGFPQDSRMLDIACGLGATLNLLNNRFTKPAIGLDRSGKMLQSTLLEKPGSNVLMGESQAIPLDAGSITGVFMECALSLSYSSLETLEEIKRVLIAGGKAVITDIYLRGMEDTINRQCLQNSHCLSGVMYQQEILDQITAAGFIVEVWQDHTPLLKNWMAGNIFRLGSAAEFYRVFTGGNDDPAFVEVVSRKIKFGYFLAILSVQNSTEVLGGGENG